jgi:hypothetical protein
MKFWRLTGATSGAGDFRASGDDGADTAQAREISWPSHRYTLEAPKAVPNLPKAQTQEGRIAAFAPSQALASGGSSQPSRISVADHRIGQL